MINISTKELYEKGLLDKVLEIKSYPYLSIEISDDAIVTLTKDEAEIIGLINDTPDS